MDVFTGIEFPKDSETPEEPMSREEAMSMIMGMMSGEQLAQLSQGIMETLTQEQQMSLMQLPAEQQQAAMMETPACQRQPLNRCSRK